MINNLHLSLLIISIILTIYLVYNLKYKRRIVLNNLDTKSTEGFSKTTIILLGIALVTMFFINQRIKLKKRRSSLGFEDNYCIQ